MYVYVYVCIYIYIHIHTRTYIYMCIISQIVMSIAVIRGGAPAVRAGVAGEVLAP